MLRYSKASPEPWHLGGDPTKSDHPRQRDFHKVAYGERNQVERTINRLKQFRRVATR